MLLLGDDLTQRLRLALCIGLALLFAFALVARNVDQLPHLPGASAEHHHVLFGSVAIENDPADDDHHRAMAAHDGHGDSDDDSGPDHMPGSHHHHADGASGFLALSSGAPALWSADSASYAAEAVRQIVGLALRGPERPPKAALMNA